MILVTGAMGMNGSAVIRELVRRKIRVRALVRDRAKAATLGQSPSLEIVEGDMLREETLGRALDGVARALMISSADPTTHRLFCVRPTTFAEFAQRHADAFRGGTASRSGRSSSPCPCGAHP
jgi:uncharacterized protein YbjT (DUF2867 family)